MKTIIAGTRTATADNTWQAIASCEWRHEITGVLCGMAKGADLHGKAWADANGIPVSKWPANWDAYGKGAGAVRNQQMADRANALIAAWDGQSTGTADMIRRAKAKGLRVHVFNYVTEEVTT
jgi:hypothetical protein